MNPNTLFPHNLHAYNEIIGAFDEGKRKVCVEHATATGKSYLITAVSDHFERVVIVIPGEEVRDQVRKTFIKESPERNLMPDFITYQKLTEDNKAGLMESAYKNKYNLIVIDEYHHTGAKEWGKAIQALIDNNTDAKVLGTTATPERYSEGGRNMSEEFFDGNVASRLDLGTAWKRKVLMAADYIIAIEDSEKFHDEFIREIEESKLMDEQKSSFKDMVKQLQHDYDLKGKEPGVVKNHLRPEAKRVIVFSKTISQAKKDERKVKGWLKQAGFKIAGSYVIDSNVGSAERGRIRDAFQNNDFEGVKVMVAVNMLNEGVHVPDVDAVFFLRKTMSPTIHLQQMGRCMKLYKEGDHRPVVFDFCNNIKNVVKDDIAQLFKSERQSFDAWQDLEQSEPTVVDKKPRKSKETEDENFPRGINYSASDYDLYEAFTRDVQYIDDWGLLEYYVKQAEEYFIMHGKKIPAKGKYTNSYALLMRFWLDEKGREERPDIVEILQKSGFEKEDLLLKYALQNEKYFIKNGEKIPSKKVDVNQYVYLNKFWRDKKRREKRPDVVEILQRSGWVDKVKEDVMMKYALQNEEYYIKHGKKIPASGKYEMIYKSLMAFWCNEKRRAKRPDVVEILQRSGWDDKVKEDVMMKYALQNEEYYKKHGKKMPKSGDYKNAYDVLKRFWKDEKRRAERPDVVEILQRSGLEDEKKDLLMKYALINKDYYKGHGKKYRLLAYIGMLILI